MKKVRGQKYFFILRLRAISKKWSYLMEGLSKLKRQDWSGVFLDIIGQQKLAYLMEGLLKTGVPEFITGSQPTSQPASQPASRPAGQPASQLAGQPAGQPAKQPASQTAGWPAGASRVI